MIAPIRRISSRPIRGPVRSMLTVAAVAVLLNGALALFGQEAQGLGSKVLPLLAPPGWLVGSVWVVLFALLGLARWRLLRSSSEPGRQGARWMVAFIIVCALYPVYTLGLRSPVAGLAGNVGTALFAVALGLNVRRVDTPSAAVMGVVTGWLCYASLVVAGQLGWL